jgi:hypothetical protein
LRDFRRHVPDLPSDLGQGYVSNVQCAYVVLDLLQKRLKHFVIQVVSVSSIDLGVQEHVTGLQADIRCLV